MRQRIVGLRVLGALLALLWVTAALLVLLGYHPGGPVDWVVRVTACLPVAIAAAAVIWPPLAGGAQARAVVAWLAIGAILLLLPSIAGLIGQLVARGPQTLLPSLEVSYGWLLALVATATFAGIGLARARLGAATVEQVHLRPALGLAALASLVVVGSFGGSVLANELALVDRPTAASRYGPTDGALTPPGCESPVAAGPAASVTMAVEARLDRRPIGTVGIVGAREGGDFRWVADVATDRVLGRYGAARKDGRRWTLEPRRQWTPSELPLDGLDLDLQVVRVALGDGERIASENLGVAIMEGARARHCRVAVDGRTFRAAVPAIGWFVGESASFDRWRGELEYWVFLDGQLGRVSGEMSGPATTIGLRGIQGTVALTMSAVERDARIVVVPPGR